MQSYIDYKLLKPDVMVLAFILTHLKISTASRKMDSVFVQIDEGEGMYDIEM